VLFISHNFKSSIFVINRDKGLRIHIYDRMEEDIYIGGGQHMINPFTNRLTEMNYLNTDNTNRYRPILRFFYEQHGHRTQLRAEEILQHLKTYEDFEKYAIEDLRQDLTVLEKWKNISSRQETSDYYTIEEFKTKKYKYQATRYTIEIERFLETLENNQADFGGGSLDKNLFDRIIEAINALISWNVDTTPEEVYRLWEDLMDYFRRLDRKTRDYMAHVSSFQAEDEMLSKAFLVRRADLINYLQDFVLILQRKLPHIEHLLTERITFDWVTEIVERVASHHLSVFLFNDGRTPESVKKRLHEEWGLLYLWFCGEDNEAKNVMAQTGQIIRKLLRFASRLLESKHFIEIANHFYQMDDTKEAHKMASVIIGAAHTKHFSCDAYDNSGKTDSFWDIDLDPLVLISRKPGYRSKGKTSGIADNKAKQKKLLQNYHKEQAEKKEQFQLLIRVGKIEMSTLPVLSSSQRQKILELTEQCMHSSDRVGRTEWGHNFHWEPGEGVAKLICLDGELLMPNGTLYLKNSGKEVSSS
jgi:uncharacterized protein (TIGR02677 family)